MNSKCDECGGQLSSNAITCPHCGSSKIKKTAEFIAGAAILVIIIRWLWNNKYGAFLLMTILNTSLILWIFDLDKLTAIIISAIFSIFLWRQTENFLNKRDAEWNKMTQEEKEEFASWYKTLTESEKDNFYKFTSEFPNKSQIQAKNELVDIHGTFKYWKSKTYSLFGFRLRKKTWIGLLIVILVPLAIYESITNRDALFGVMTEKQLSTGCTCWENSKLHPDRMSPGEEKIRYKCLDVFYKISEARDQTMKEVMKEACESQTE